MGVDCKGICVTDFNKEDTIISLVEKELRDLIDRKKCSENDSNNVYHSTNKTSSEHFFQFTLTLNGEKRTLSLFTNIQNEQDDPVLGKKLRWSLAFGGDATEIVVAVGYALKDLGQIYIDYNDCDNEDFIPMDKEINRVFIKKELK